MNKKRLLFIVIFSLIILIFFGIVMAHELKHGDFPPHIAWAKEYSTNGYLYKIPHTLFAKLVVIIRALLPANAAVWISPLAKQVYDLKSFELSTLILMSLTYLSVGLIILFRMIRDWDIKQNKFLFFSALATFSIMIVGPIFLFTFPDRMFLGYITGNRFDSPTYILSKPFVLLVFIGIVDNFFSKWNWKQGFIMVLVMMCATLAKPSLTITIIPAIGIVILLNLKKFKLVNWGYFFIPMGLTAAIVLFFQFIINYVGDRGDRIIIAPFKAILYYVPNLSMVALLIFLSIFFPLFVTIIYWRRIQSNVAFQLAWVNFFVSLAYAFIFAEEINLPVNNFWNSPMIAVFVLFFVTVTYWGKSCIEKIQNKEKLTINQIVASGILGLHIVCGIIYYCATIASTTIMVN